MSDKPSNIFGDEYRRQQVAFDDATQERKVYREALKAQRASWFSDNPEGALSIYSQEEYLAKQRKGTAPSPPEITATLTQGVLDWIGRIEQIYYANNEAFPVSFLVNMDLDSLDQFSATAGVDLKGMMAQHMYETTLRGVKTQQEKQIEEGIRIRENAHNASNNMLGRVIGGSAGFLSGAGAIEGAEAGADIQRAMRDTAPFDREKAEAEVRVELNLTDFGNDLMAAQEEEIDSWRVRRRVELIQDEEIFMIGRGETGEVDMSRVDERLENEELDKRNLINQGFDPRETLNQQSILENMTTGTMGAFGWAINKAAQGVGGAVWLYDYATPTDFTEGAWTQVVNPYQQFQENHEAARYVARAEFQDSRGTQAERDFMGGFLTGQAYWEALGTEDPEMRQQWIDAANGDEIVAAGWFMAQAQDLEEVQKMNEEWAKGEEEEANIILQELEEKNYRVSDDLLNVLAVWGRNVPGRLATSATLLMSDPEYWDMFTSQKYGDLWDEIGKESASYDHTPSAAIGIDGSMAGLLMDLGLMAAFDPTTYIFGPRLMGAAKTSLGSTVSGAMKMAKSPVIKVIGRDIVNFWGDISRGASSAYRLVDWLDPISLQELNGIMRFTSPTFRHNKWRGHKTGQSAQMVETTWLEQLVKRADLEDVHGVDSVAAKINKCGGFEEALTVKVSRVDGSMVLDDGMKRYAAALQEDWSMVPVRFQLVDDVIEGAVTKLDDLDGFAGNMGELTDNLGTAIVRPDRMFQREALLGPLDDMAIARVLERAIVERGARPTAIANSTLHSMLPSRVRHAIKSGIPTEVRALFSQKYTSARLMVQGPDASKTIMDNVLSLWGDDIASADGYILRVMDHDNTIARTAAINNTKLKGMFDEHTRLSRALDEAEGMNRRVVELKKNFDEGLEAGQDISEIGGQLNAQRQAAQNRTKALKEEVNVVERAMGKVQDDLQRIPDGKELAKIVEDMYDDFNRQHIAPRWDPSDLDETGLLPWHKLQDGNLSFRTRQPSKTGWVTESLRELAEANGLAVDDMARLIHGSPDNIAVINTPVSVLDALAAATVTGRGWSRWQQMGVAHGIRDMTYAMNKLWIIDKVLKPATGMTVSADELLRIFHETGNAGVARYAADKALFMYGRTQTMIHGGNPLSRTAVSQGSRYSPRLQQRLGRLSEHSYAARNLEKAYQADNGLGFVDVSPGDPTYAVASNNFTKNIVDQSGFRAYLKSPEAFNEWFWGPEGAEARAMTVIQGKGKNQSMVPISGPDDLWAGMDNYFNELVLREAHKKGTAAEVRQAFKDAAAKTDEIGATQELPAWASEMMGEVRAMQKPQLQGMNPAMMTDYFFDRLFMDPINYRRGFLADFTARMETARLESLFGSQGKRIVSDAELGNLLGMRGINQLSGHGMRGWLDDMAFAEGVVTQGHLDRLVKRAVDSEMEHVLYNTEMGSRMGRGVARSGLFPFGKPWADMAAYWGREGMRTPVLRGAWAQKNLGLFEKAMTAKGHFNPKTAALLSRMAHTDFRIDQGWTGTGIDEGESVGLWPGSETTDLGNLLFLPTQGDNPFGAVLPGFGYAPLYLFDQIAAKLHDPIKDPEGWSAFIDAVGDFVPSAHFGNPRTDLALLQRFIGGGNIAQFSEVMLDLATLGGNTSGHSMFATAMGQPDRLIDRTRSITAKLANDEEWDELLSFSTGEEFDVALAGLTLESDQEAAKGNILENMSRFVAPSRSKYSGDLDTIHEVWIDAGQAFSSLDVDPDYDPETASPEEARRYSNSVRSAFFDLPSFERDLLMVQQRTLAVNLVSNWEWTDDAVARGVEGSSATYRILGNKESLDRHQIYVNAGYIRPLEPAERVRRILGTYYRAKESVAKSIYLETAKEVNNLLWEHTVTPTTKTLLQAILDRFPEDTASIGVRTPRELWAQFATLEEVYEQRIAEGNDIPQVRSYSRKKDEQTAFDRLRTQISIPTDEKPWGTVWPGVDPSKLTNKFAQIRPPWVSETAQQAAEALGLEITAGMTGREIYSIAQEAYGELEGPARLSVDPAYRAYVGELGAEGAAADNELRKIAFKQDLEPEYNEMVQDFLMYEVLMAGRYRDTQYGTPTIEALDVQGRYMNIMEAGSDLKVDWLRLWEMRYERTYGVLGWVPPEPPGVTENSYQAVVHRVVDGDTVVVRQVVGDKQGHTIRLLGTRARDYGLDNDGAATDKTRLVDALQAGIEAGLPIYFVRQPEIYGNVDPYGRELSWLYIGDEPFFFPEELDPRRDPGSGS